MKLVDLANSVYRTELNEDSTISIPSLMAYFRYNVGDINNLLGTCFKLNQATLEIVDEHGCELNSEAAMIYKNLYLISYYTRMIRNFTGVGGINLLVEATSDGGTLRFSDRSNLAKLYVGLRKNLVDELYRMVNKYKYSHDSKAQQVVGDDTQVSLTSYPYREQGVPYQSIL